MNDTVTNILQVLKDYSGIIGAVLGSTSTLVITNIFKKCGKLKLYLMNFEGEYVYYDKTFGGTTYQKTDKSKIDLYNLKFSIDIYNSSEEPKIMRDIKLCIFQKKKLLYKESIKDEDTRKISQIGSYANNLNICNIKGKESISLNLSIKIPKQIAINLKNEVIFKYCYRNEKNKVKYFQIFEGKIEEN